MRTKLKQVRSLDDLGNWWYETPYKRPRAIRTLLLEPGRGWLRWKMAENITWSYYEPPNVQMVAPPLRRWFNLLLYWKFGFYKKWNGGWGWDSFPSYCKYYKEIEKDPDWPEFYL